MFVAYGSHCNHRSVSVYGLSWSMARKSIYRHKRSGDDSHSTYYFAKKNTIWKTSHSIAYDEKLYYSK